MFVIGKFAKTKHSTNINSELIGGETNMYNVGGVYRKVEINCVFVMVWKKIAESLRIVFCIRESVIY